MNIFTPPRAARIVDAKYHRFSAAFAQMGLAKPEFRAAGQSEDGKKVFVHPDDISKMTNEPLSIRGDMVEFIDQGK